MEPAPPPGASRPRFRRHLRVEVGDNEVFLFDEAGVATLRGAAVVALSPFLDGSHDCAAIVAARPAGLSGDEIGNLTGQLVRAGLVTVEPIRADRPEAELAWWDAVGVDQADLRRPGTVGLSVLDRGDEMLFASALVGAGVEVVPVRPAVNGSLAQAGAPQIDVVVCADYLDPCLAEVDADHRKTGRPWLLVKPDGVRAWIGPFFEPSVTACWQCLASRLWTHRGAEAVVQAVLGRHGPAPRPVAAVPSMTAAVAHLVALEISKWLAGYRHPGQRCVWIFDAHDLSGERHELRLRPQCPACGDPGLVVANALRPVRMRPAPKIRGDGGDRTLSAGDMRARFRHLVSPVTGIVKQVQRDPYAPDFAHAYRSGPNHSRRIAGMGELRQSMRSENGGKGFTALDAEVGAMCEAAERYSGIWQGDEQQVRASLTQLGRRAIDPRTCLLFDDRQHESREEWNAAHSPFNVVPPRFDPEAEISWTPVWSISSEGYRLLPTAMLYYGAPAAPGLFADSNGCAAGSSIEDAVLQGALELVERDAVAQWWYNRLVVPGVDLAAFPDPRFAEQQRNHASIGRALWALDVTSDLGVPTVVAVSRRLVGDDERILFGFGTHFDPSTAVRRALSEVNQMLVADHLDLRTCNDPDLTTWVRHAILANQPYLRPDRGIRARRPTDFINEERPDIADDVSALVARFAEAGMETYVLDQTRPDIGIPVVRVVVPGMRSFWSRYAPGRLFDVPVRSGRLSRPTLYDELNPIPLFL